VNPSRASLKLAFAVVLGTLLASCASEGTASSQTAPPSRTETLVTPVRVVTATTGELRSTRALSAKVVAATDSIVVAEASGRVLRVLRKPGDRVRAKETVLQLDVASLEDNLTDARLALRAARVNLDTARRQNPEDRLQADKRLIAARETFDNARRLRKANERLYAMGGVSQVDLRSARSAEAQASAELEAARAQVTRLERASSEGLEGLRLAVAQAQNRVRQLERDVARGEVTAPFSGEVAQVFAQQGEYLGGGARAFRLIDPSRLRLNFAVSAADAASLEVGRGALVRVGSRSLEARVSRNALVPGDDRLVPIGARFVGGQNLSSVTAGNTVRLEYSVKVARGALLPTGALRLEGERRFVFVVAGGVAKQREVRVQGESLGRIAVTGVNEKERVVYPIPSSLAQGSNVRVVNP
jgi:HlyD family secretion protein